MSYVPPGYAPQVLAPGVHKAYLVEITPIVEPVKLQKFGAMWVCAFSYKSVQNGIEVKDFVKFTGGKADFYAGQTIDRLHMLAGLPEPTPGEAIDISALTVALSGVEIDIEINDKGYVQQVIVPEPSNGTEEAF